MSAMAAHQAFPTSPQIRSHRLLWNEIHLFVQSAIETHLLSTSWVSGPVDSGDRAGNRQKSLSRTHRSLYTALLLLLLPVPQILPDGKTWTAFCSSRQLSKRPQHLFILSPKTAL